MNKAKILVIEDDKAIRNLMAMALETHGYLYHTASTGQAAIVEAISYHPNLILLDLGLPDMDGIDIIKKIRSWSNVPIIVVSARSDDKDKITALDMGADDYLTKPFCVEELLARLRATLRRVEDSPNDALDNATIFANGDLKIDYSAGCVFINNQEVHLTPIEYKLLCLLSKNVGKVLTHNYILSQVWNNPLASDTPSLRVFMATLRKKIETSSSEAKYIQTHIGIGYRMLRIE